MSTILKFEWARKKKKAIAYCFIPPLVMLFLFLASLVIEYWLPDFNAVYMKWPSMLRDFLCISGWSSRLWVNIWQLLAICFPFWLIASMMWELAASVAEEKRLETTVYLNNAGIPKMIMPMAKFLFWTSVTLVICVLVTLAGALFLKLLHNPLGISNVFSYGFRLTGVLLLYLAIALFMAVCRGRKCGDVIVNLIFYPWLVSRISVSLCFFSNLLVMTGREGALIEQLDAWGKKLKFLEILCPLTWTFPAAQLRGVYGWLAGTIFVIMMLAAFAINNRKNLI